MLSRHAILALFVSGSFLMPPAVRAQGEFDSPQVAYSVIGQGKIRVTVTAGATGAPGGFSIWWMRKSDYLANGSAWFEYGDPRQGEASFAGPSDLLFVGDSPVNYSLGPGESATFDLGSLSDDSAVTLNNWRAAWYGELDYGTEYVLCGYANAAGNVYRSQVSETLEGTTILSTNCTFTIGYWRNHPSSWPVGSLMLGGNTYTAAELMAILNQPTSGNGLVSLAKQLIAAKLNIAAGADPSAIAATIAAADAMIGSLIVPPVGSGFLHPASTSGLRQTLDDYNNGVIGPGHCGPTPARRATWGAVKAARR